jgi:Fic family protein
LAGYSLLETPEQINSNKPSSLIGGFELLPLLYELETKAVLKKLAKAHRALAELKGVSSLIPNENILLNTLALQEAKDSSAIENIITTQDDLYQSDAQHNQFTTLAAKEVHHYRDALKAGYYFVQQKGLLTNQIILDMQALLEENDAGFRKVPGTALKNEQTGDVVYNPPQDAQDIIHLMSNLEQFINDDSLSDWDPLIKMAVIHHQFESIHPFYDGNGRTGRIINILYLVKQELLNTPILYLSRYINQNRASYYHLLQATRTEKNWEPWLIYMLDGIEQTALQTVQIVQEIRALMLQFKQQLRNELPKIYSQDLLNSLFSHPYTKVDFIIQDLGIHRNTASKYLESLIGIGMLSKHKLGKENFYLNDALFRLLSNPPHLSMSNDTHTS